MLKLNHCGLVFLLLALCATPALAGAPAGATGLFRIPTADVVQPGVLGAEVQIEKNSVYAGLTYGLLDFLEIGATAGFHGDAVGELAPFVKGQFFPETANDPGMAAGIHGDSAYVVLSKRLAPLLRGHAGIGTGHLSGVFFGVSYLMNPVVVSKPDSFTMPRILLIGEFDTRTLNAGARFSFAQGLDVNLYVRDLDEVVIGAAWSTRF